MFKDKVIEFLHHYLPPAMKRWLRAVLKKNEKILTKVAPSFREYVRSTPFDGMNESFLSNLLKYIDKNIPILLQVRELRQLLARERLKLFLEKETKIRQIDNQAEKMAHNTIQHNLNGLLEAVELD